MSFLFACAFLFFPYLSTPILSITLTTFNSSNSIEHHNVRRSAAPLSLSLNSDEETNYNPSLDSIGVYIGQVDLDDYPDCDQWMEDKLFECQKEYRTSIFDSVLNRYDNLNMSQVVKKLRNDRQTEYYKQTACCGVWRAQHCLVKWMQENEKTIHFKQKCPHNLIGLYMGLPNDKSVAANVNDYCSEYGRDSPICYQTIIHGYQGTKSKKSYFFFTGDDNGSITTKIRQILMVICLITTTMVAHWFVCLLRNYFLNLWFENYSYLSVGKWNNRISIILFLENCFCLFLLYIAELPGKQQQIVADFFWQSTRVAR